MKVRKIYMKISKLTLINSAFKGEKFQENQIRSDV